MRAVAAVGSRPIMSASTEGALLPAGILAGAVFFNFVLAIINQNVTPLSSLNVIAAEMLIVSAAHAVCLIRFRPEMLTWYALLWFLILVGFARWLWLADIDLKSIRDVIIIPTFICLGIAFGTRSLNRTVLAIHALVLSFVIFEAAFPQQFSSLVGIKSYYINTRGFSESSFWNTGSDLFVSATRPDERYFMSSLGLHRLSSVFLEPVSLGNYCVIITAFVCARFKTLTRSALIFLIASNVVLLIGCDGRLAIATSALILVSMIAVRALSPFCFLYLPVAITFAFLVHYGLGYQVGPDNFSGRIALTADILAHYRLQDLFGVAKTLPFRAADSGIAYMIAKQSIFGLLVIWAFVVSAGARDKAEELRYRQAVCLYLALTMIVSYSFFSIKTAALLWFILGALQNPYSRDNVPVMGVASQ
jgi:putative polymerase